LVIDDINSRSTEEFVSHLSVIKTIKAVGTSLIQFLSQLENFQKRLWLKKKMVVQADYCITLDRVPEELYAEICANDCQREEWVRLFAIDEIKGYPLTVEFLKENPFLVLDTAFFSKEFKQKLISSIDNLDEQCNGLMSKTVKPHSLVCSHTLCLTQSSYSPTTLSYRPIKVRSVKKRAMAVIPVHATTRQTSHTSSSPQWLHVLMLM
jgi:hypothetical protein